LEYSKRGSRAWGILDDSGTTTEGGMGMSEFKNRRKKLVINKPVQRRIIFAVSFVPILGLVGATLAVALLAGRVLDEARLAEVNLPTLAPLFVSLFFFILTAGALVVVQALRYSHRIAGPMYRICQSIKRVRERDLDFEVTLRDGDELTEIATELNHLISTLKKEGFGKVENTQEELSAKVGEEKKEETILSGSDAH
jgi:nitrate/nitrite-specific signal transduction histidine kinase